MYRFIYNSSTFKCISSKLFSTSAKLPARFTRNSIRERLKKLDKSTGNKSFNGETVISHIRPDSIPIRPLKDLWKAFTFTIVIGSGCFTAAAIIEYERHRSKMKNLFSDLDLSTLFNNENQFPKLSDGQKVALGIVGLNTLVFLLWRIPAIERYMWQYFSNSYASRSLCSPMLLSTFSHYSLLHLGLNMYVLYNFVPVSINKFLGPEQFTAFYLTSGVISSFTSIAHKAVTKSPIRALGASGAILGALCYVCMKMPSAKLNIVFLPMFTFSAESAVYGLIIFDLAGLLLGFKLFDHAAHLGGALFGLFYACYGEKFVNQHIYPTILRYYRKVRGPKSPPSYPPSIF